MGAPAVEKFNNRSIEEVRVKTSLTIAVICTLLPLIGYSLVRILVRPHIPHRLWRTRRRKALYDFPTHHKMYLLEQDDRHMKLHRVLAPVALTLGLISTSGASHAAGTYLVGNVTNFTSLPLGLLLMLDSGVPTNCQGTPSGWMLIKAENKVMISMVLTMYAMGKKGAAVYTSGMLGSGFCEINQYDPIE